MGGGQGSRGLKSTAPLTLPPVACADPIILVPRPLLQEGLQGVLQKGTSRTPSSDPACFVPTPCTRPLTLQVERCWPRPSARVCRVLASYRSPQAPGCLSIAPTVSPAPLPPPSKKWKRSSTIRRAKPCLQSPADGSCSPTTLSTSQDHCELDHFQLGDLTYWPFRFLPRLRVPQNTKQSQRCLSPQQLRGGGRRIKSNLSYIVNLRAA